MIDFIKSFFVQKMVLAFEKSYQKINKRIIAYNKKKNFKLKILDIGCADFVTTKKYLKNVKNYQLYALDHFETVEDKSVIYNKIDLENGRFPFDNNFFDVIIAGQVIEHVLNKDHLIEESYRVLKKKGLFVCATENIASFDNIISLLFGQEPLSQHTGSKFNTNSFLSPHFMEKESDPNGNKYQHKNICSYFGLQRLLKVNGFKNCKIISIGNAGIIFEKIFKIYNRLIVVFCTK